MGWSYFFGSECIVLDDLNQSLEFYSSVWGFPPGQDFTPYVDHLRRNKIPVAQFILVSAQFNRVTPHKRITQL